MNKQAPKVRKTSTNRSKKLSTEYLENTYLFHGSNFNTRTPSIGNSKYKVCDINDLIANKKNCWSIVTLLIAEDLKVHADYMSINKPTYWTDVKDRIAKKHHSMITEITSIEGENDVEKLLLMQDFTDKLLNIAYFAVPSPKVDLKDKLDGIVNLFTSEELGKYAIAAMNNLKDNNDVQ